MKKTLSFLILPLLACAMASAQSKPATSPNNGAGTQTAQTDDANRTGDTGNRGHDYGWIGLLGLLGLAGLRKNNAARDYRGAETTSSNREQIRRAG